MNANDLEALAVQAEQATGADREIDAQVGRYFAADFLGYVPDEAMGGCAKFTASIDAALMLVPKGEGHWPQIYYTSTNPNNPKQRHRWKIWTSGINYFRGEAATPALALTAAALRAQVTRG